MSVDVAAESVLGRGEGGLSVRKRWPYFSVGRCWILFIQSVRFGSVRSGWIGLVLVSIYERVEEKTGHVHVLFRNR